MDPKYDTLNLDSLRTKGLAWRAITGGPILTEPSTSSEPEGRWPWTPTNVGSNGSHRAAHAGLTDDTFTAS